MRYLSLLLSALLIFPGTPAALAQAPKINLVIVEGEGAINNVRQRTAREPIVQVEDENRKPVAGAAVVFSLPSQGAGGTFASGSHTMTVMTDSRGRAIARGFRPNNVEGQFQIRVNASINGQTASAAITQTNALAAAAVGGAAAAGISAKLLAVLVAVGAAAVTGGVVAATRDGDSGTATPTTVSAGPNTVGAPR